MYFASKKDIWLGLTFFGSAILIAGIYLFEGEEIGLQINGFIDVIGITLSLLTVGLLLWIWFGTSYKVEAGLIKIKSGPFRSRVKINEIKKVRATKNPLSALALSIDRIEILYGKYGMTLISPKEKKEFIEVLIAENPGIQVHKNLQN